jgi:hypothetical protein
MRRLANGFYNFHKAYKGVDKLYKNCNIHMKNYGNFLSHKMAFENTLKKTKVFLKTKQDVV